MVQRTLPIYQTGWFYLLLLFGAVIFSAVSTGYLNSANQLNFSLLKNLSPNPAPSNSSSPLTANEMLTLHSSFQEYDVEAIATLLENFPNSTIILLGKQSKAFMARFESYLSSADRANKVIIASNVRVSGEALEKQTDMILAELINWFRYSTTSIKRINSDYFIFSPFLLNQRQSFPLVWQQQDKTYLSLLGEVLQQLSPNEALYLDEQWKLTLTNPQNSVVPQQLATGFFGEVFISGEPYSLQSLGSRHKQKYIEYTASSTQNASPKKRNIITPLLTVKRFVENESLTIDYKRNLAMYKVIIIKDDSHPEHNMLGNLIEKLSSQQYLSQSLLIVLSSWIFTIVGIVLVWFIRQLVIRQQANILACYLLALFAIQYFMFHQQQWLEILPVILLVAGTWLIAYAYQKEYMLFVQALNYQGESSTTSKKALERSDNNGPELANKQGQLAQKQLKTSLPKTTTAASNMAETLKINATNASENLDQTLVIVDSPHSQNTMKRSPTVENFGRYQVEGILGKGAMGIVYQGVDPKINRHVAIKTLQLSDNIDSPELREAKERFFREAQTAGGLSHANIVTIYDVGEENNLGYIAMDLLTGAPLSLFTQPGQTLPIPLVYQLLIQITDALDYAHNQNIVHRDIKPANIIYDDDLLKVTVTDFGIAYVSDHSKTRTGIIMGSPYYMSPEQILGLKVDGRSDIFSLGVTFYQLLCGHLPFEGESIATVAYQITKAKAEAVNQRNTKLPASALRITNKAMHKDIEKRYQTMAEFKLALINALKRDFKISSS